MGHPPLRLHQLLHGTGPKLLLFAGAKASKQGFERLAIVIAGVQHRYGNLVQPLLVAILPTGVPHRGTTGPSDAGISELTPQLPELLACPLLLDPGGALHRRYGALRDSVYLIRPDDHIGYRGQPAQADPLLRYLSKLFV